MNTHNDNEIETFISEHSVSKRQETIFNFNLFLLFKLMRIFILFADSVKYEEQLRDLENQLRHQVSCANIFYVFGDHFYKLEGPFPK